MAWIPSAGYKFIGEGFKIFIMEINWSTFWNFKER